MSTALLLSPAVVCTTLAVVGPLVMISWVSLWRLTPDFRLEKTLDGAAWESVWTEQGLRATFVRTLEIGAAVLLLVALVGTLAAYCLARFVRSRRVQIAVLFLVVLPFWTSYLIRIITWQPIYGERGLLNYLLVKSRLVDQPVQVFLYNSTAVTLTMSSLYVAFVIGPVYWAFQRIDADIVHASRTLGASPWATFWRVELPLAKGGLIAGLFFVVIFFSGDVATQRIIGGGTSPMMADAVQRYAANVQWPVASAIAVSLVGMTLVVLAALLRVHDLRRDL
jgi:putative spermidine/putrescine transport system permease protein